MNWKRHEAPTKIVIVENKDGHKFEHTMKKTNHFCPVCASQNVWCDVSTQDFNVGFTYYCLDGWHRSHLDKAYTIQSSDNNSRQIVMRLREQLI